MGSPLVWLSNHNYVSENLQSRCDVTNSNSLFFLNLAYRWKCPLFFMDSKHHNCNKETSHMLLMFFLIDRWHFAQDSRAFTDWCIVRRALLAINVDIRQLMRSWCFSVTHPILCQSKTRLGITEVSACRENCVSLKRQSWTKREFVAMLTLRDICLQLTLNPCIHKV